MKTCVPSVRRRSFLLVTMVVLSLASRAFAVDLLVYNKNDSGAGSLRQAISDNNALSGGNTIVFSNTVTGTITLTGGQLSISKNLTLMGPGANVLAVSGNNAGRVFLVTNAAIVSISGLTVSNGSLSRPGPYPRTRSKKFSSGGVFNPCKTGYFED